VFVFGGVAGERPLAGKKRERLESGEPRHPWKEDPSLSSRPPFEPGNTVSVRHGAVSDRLLAPTAERLEEELVVVAPDPHA
jgi:hypothetical protein